MNVIDSFSVSGFWGHHELESRLDSHINFFIGINGSGKTTAINLLVAALTADFSLLDRLSFDRIEIKLKSKGNRKKPIIEIIKRASDVAPFPTIEYRIRNSASEKPTSYVLEDYKEQIYYRNYQRIHSKELRRQYGRSIVEHLSQLVQVSWLSVHRASPSEESERKSYASTVDRKLSALSNQLVRYFSTLGKQGAVLLEKFQETVFLSLLLNENQGLIFDDGRKKEIDSERNALIDIFTQFGLEQRRYKKRVDKHFDVLDTARQKINSEDESVLSSIEIAALVATDRIDNVVDEWRRLVNSRTQVYLPRDRFLSIINNLMQRKEFFINEQNELCARTDQEATLPLQLLSSGEKQLIIVLGEALLQEGSTWIYIADEPELSLHVNWQESLISNLRAINPNAQIVFATHSPDVVSSYGENVLKMENVLR